MKPVYPLLLTALLFCAPATAFPLTAVPALDPAVQQGSLQLASSKTSKTTGRSSGTADSKASGDEKDGPTVIQSLRFSKGKKGSERVCVGLSRAEIPTFFALEGDKPRFVIDIARVTEWQGETIIPVEGILITQVRVYLHHKSKKLRIVLDLANGRDFMVVPGFSEEERVFCAEVREAQASQGTQDTPK